jgi:hypothetical protein
MLPLDCYAIALRKVLRKWLLPESEKVGFQGNCPQRISLGLICNELWWSFPILS